MYGRYNKLGEFAKLESLKAAERKRIKAEKARNSELRGYQGEKKLHNSSCLVTKTFD